MKNGLLVWNVVLTAIAGYLLFANLSKKETKSRSGRTVAGDSLSAPSAFRIAYFEMDSVENNFDMVKEVKAEISKKDEEYNNALGQLEWTYQKKLQEYKDKEKNGTLTQADVDKAPVELRQLEESLKGRRQEIDQQYQNFVMTQNLNVKRKIEDFLTEYNKEKKFSYIVSYEQGLFYYKDTAYNITADLVKGLNAEHKKK